MRRLPHPAERLFGGLAPPDADPAGGFTADYVSANLGGLVFNSGRFSAYSLQRAQHPLGGAPLDHWSLLLGRKGEAFVEAGDREIHAGPRDLFLVSLDQDFRGRMTDYEGAALFLPRDLLADSAAKLDAASNTILAGPLAALLADYLVDLEKRIVGMNEEELVEAGKATLAMVAACVRPERDRLFAAQNLIEAALFERARAFIMSHLGAPDLGPEVLAKQLGVSRSSLYRAFEPVGGVARYIQHSRLLAARAALYDQKDKRITDIAYAYGFRSAADFTRAFRREFGFNPREMREIGDK